MFDAFNAKDYLKDAEDVVILAGFETWPIRRLAGI